MFNEADQEDTQKFSLVLHGTDMELSDNFTLGEFACKDGSDKVLVHPYLALMLQALRNHFGVPVTMSNAYRTWSHHVSIYKIKNAKRKAKGLGPLPVTKQSAHLLGMAADVKVKKVRPEKVYEYLETLNPGGLGIYNTFVHCDVKGSFRRWDNRT